MIETRAEWRGSADCCVSLLCACSPIFTSQRSLKERRSGEESGGTSPACVSAPWGAQTNTDHHHRHLCSVPALLSLSVCSACRLLSVFSTDTAQDQDKSRGDAVAVAAKPRRKALNDGERTVKGRCVFTVEQVELVGGHVLRDVSVGEHRLVDAGAILLELDLRTTTRQRQCLSHGRGQWNTRGRSGVCHEVSGNTRQRQCLSHEESGKREVGAECHEGSANARQGQCLTGKCAIFFQTNGGHFRTTISCDWMAAAII